MVSFRTDDDRVFKALADVSRRELLDRLYGRGGQSLNELCQGLEMTRPAVAKHLRILEEANLVSVQWKGREKLHFINPRTLDRQIRAAAPAVALRSQGSP